METIKSSGEISEIFSKGKRSGNRYISLFYVNALSDSQDINTAFKHDREGRVAFIAGKRNGNAVWRNSAKRRMRAIIQDLNPDFTGLDVLIIAKPLLLNESYSKVFNACEETIFSLLGKIE